MRGNSSRALSYFQRALATVERVAPNSRSHATYLNNIGSTYQDQGDLEQALVYRQRALAIIEKTAPNSQGYAALLNNIAGVYMARGDLGRANALPAGISDYRGSCP